MSLTSSCLESSELVIGPSFRLAAVRCLGSLSCEYLFDPVGLIDPAPGCIKELVVNYSCPDRQTYETRAMVSPGELATMRIQCGLSQRVIQLIVMVQF